MLQQLADRQAAFLLAKGIHLNFMHSFITWHCCALLVAIDGDVAGLIVNCTVILYGFTKFNADIINAACCNGLPGSALQLTHRL